ncbi:DNA recombination protein RmuC [Candidatus Avelusimicrobium gallicola]|uniref:DNA recombination protein RmuC n=1 Tax=Candidatus Avelusimicrobium gallicola TaxID=2562704 RepID=A0A1Y4DBK5_9BACT|nr:DNA recombination protein RmuC [Elusimicrobium sp. An273]OUO56446.1 hypothetical protein B5F75_04435 [Elusimicrobium sp. An273]
MFYIICLLVGMAIGSGAAWAALAGKIKWLTAEQQRLLALEPELNRLRAENAALQVEKTRLEQEKVSLEKEKTLIEKNFKELSGTYQAQFAQLASKILDDKTKGLEAKNSEALRPLTLHLESFVKKVAEMERQNTAVQARLEKGLSDVIKSTEKIDQSALHLTNAIKGEAIVRGSWGEETLKRILDAAGMKEGLDYYQQVSEEGKRVDVQIALPADRWIVVDSKTIFNHYARYFNAQDPKEKETFLNEHVKDVKKTIKDLSSKKYYKKFQAEGDKVQPDYTLMFVYPESALLAAVEADPDILNEAWKNNIALVSATSLMSTLKMVSKLWDIDKQHEYMEDFKEDILKLLEKFNDFLVNFAKAENAVSAAADAVKIARGHIDGNRGAFLPVAQRIVDIYEVPLTKENARLLKRMNYDYTGHKSKNHPAAKEIPPADEKGLFD